MKQGFAVRVDDPAGLHARPAGEIAAIAASFDDSEALSIRHGGREANARSVLEMLSLGVTSGAVVEVLAPDLAAQRIAAALGAVIGVSDGGAPGEDSAHRERGQRGDDDLVNDDTGVGLPLWTPELVDRFDRADDAADAIRQLGERLISLGAINREYLDATIKRERAQPTGIPAEPPFAIAHSEAGGVRRFSLAMGVFAEPVSFGRMDDPQQHVEVRTVALLAVPGRSHHAAALKSVIDLLANPTVASQLATADDAFELWRVLASAAPELTATGSGSAGAVATESSEPPPTAPEPAASVQRTHATEFSGVAVSPGIALAPALLVAADASVDSTPLDKTQIAPELAALGRVLEAAAAGWREEAEVSSGEHAEVMNLYAAMAKDPALRAGAEERIRAGERIAVALAAAGESHVRMLREVDDDYLAARADDVRGVVRALGRIAADAAAGEQEGSRILIGNGLTVLDLPAGLSVAGVVDEAGSTTSHLGMVARSRGIPAVFGIGAGFGEVVAAGTQVLLDGWSGVVVVDPDPVRVAESQHLDVDRRAAAAALATNAAGITGTRDGTVIEFAVNAACVDDIRSAVAQGADGVGLLRTELAFADSARRPTFAQQRDFFARAISAAAGRRLVVRTFDFGTDKPARFLPVAAEENPALGVRGIRLERNDPELIADQVRALVAAAQEHEARNVGIMAPMVTTLDEARAFRDLVRSVDPHGRLEIGVMVEVPSLILIAAEVAAIVDFFSIGTNDLTQYLQAVDRLNPAVADLHDPSSPALLRAVAMICDAAQDADIWVGVCGEAASDPEWAALAVGLGVTELSVRADRLADVAVAVGALTLDEARAAAANAIRPGAIRTSRERKH